MKISCSQLSACSAEEASDPRPRSDCEIRANLKDVAYQIGRLGAAISLMGCADSAVLTLYSTPGTCALAVHIALEWSELPYDVKLFGPSQAYLSDPGRTNPLCRVPVMVLEDGTVIREATALLTYIDTICPCAFRMPGQSPLGRGRLAEWFSYLTTEIRSAFEPHFRPSQFLADRQFHESLRHTAYERLLRILDLLDDSVTEPYIFGRSFSVCDAYLYVITRWIDDTPLELDNFPFLSAFKRRMELDQAVNRALLWYGAPHSRT